MLKNYLLTDWRNLRRNPFYSVINISGLAIGLAVGMLILLWVQDESSYNTFHQHAANIYKINCLFGVATYTAQIKTKEIGIRRVLGATVIQVTSLLAREFVLLVGISLLIATPLAWWSMNQWLQNYTYRTQLNAWIFLATGGTVLLLALVTVCIQAVRAALANPVKSLRPE